MDKKKILEFIKSNKLTAISTVNISGLPESAVIEFGETNNLEIIFDTLKSSRKYRNLQSNKNVAFVIGWDENITVQFEGVASELNGEELQKCKHIYFSRNSRAKKIGTCS